MFSFKINMYVLYDELDLTATFNLGNDETVQGFFTNIAYHLENKKWGSVYPTIMNKFYSGKLEQKHIKKAIKEIKDIKKKLSKIDFTQMIFDMESVPDKKYLKETIDISLDDVFVNNKREKMTDIILIVLKSVRKKKTPLYIGQYYYKELYNDKVIDIIENTKKKQKRNMIIKYLIYLLIVLIIKSIATEQQFNQFIMKFIYSMIIAELIIFNSKKNIENKVKESEKRREEKFNNDEPKMTIENITLERNLLSSTFDRILDEINCPKNFDAIIKTVKAKRIKNWQKDLEKIHNDLGCHEKSTNEIIEDLEYNIEKYDKFEYYQIENIYTVIPKEKIETIYNEFDIYRLIIYDNHMNLIIFNNPKK